MDGHDNSDKPIIGYDELMQADDNPVFFLGHSCDEWIIGDINKAREFIGMLSELINEVEKNPDYRADGNAQWE